MAVEGAAFHQPMYEQRAQDYQPKLREMLGRGLAIDAASYSRAKERRLQFVTDMELLAEKADVLLTPHPLRRWLTFPTPGIPCFRALGPTLVCPLSPFPPE